MLYIGIYATQKNQHATPLVYGLPIVKVLTELVYTELRHGTN